MVPEIRPRAACARRGVLDSGCLRLWHHTVLCSVHHFSSTFLESTFSSRTFSARTLSFVCRRHLSLLMVRNYFEGFVLERVLCRMQTFRATPPAPHFGDVCLFVGSRFSSFSHLFSGSIFLCFFHDFTSLFNDFSMNFNGFYITFWILFKHVF